MIYTAFCQEKDGTGTIWVDTVEAAGKDDAIQEARERCAADWEYPVSDVHCLGLAEGTVALIHWEDQGV